MTITICACLASWDEDDEMRDRRFRSLDGIVDDYVAVHEMFKGYPGAPEDARSQIEVRADLMQRGVATGCSHLLVIDADEVVTRADPEALRAALNATDLHVGTVSYTDVGGHPETYPRLYRALPDLTVKYRHNGYHSAIAGGFLHGTDYRNLDPNQVLDCTRWLHIRHDTNLRTPERTRAQIEYRHARADAGER